MIISSQDIAQYRSQLSDIPEALLALDVIEDCEGDVEDAAISLALKIGQEPTTTENWLEDLAKRCRVEICEPQFQSELQNGQLKSLIEYLFTTELCPKLLVIPIVIYVVKLGVNQFCQSVMNN